MRNILGLIFKILGGITFAICGIWGFIIELAIIVNVAGFWGLVVGFIILPVTFLVAPFYALVAWGNWFPLLLIYGGGITAAILFGIGMVISKED